MRGTAPNGYAPEYNPLWEADLPRTEHAMAALKAAMAWDEQVYGREYDLGIFNIVAVADFNFGAMENKGLNVFNSRYILADPETATDGDYDAIAGVVKGAYRSWKVLVCDRKVAAEKSDDSTCHVPA